MLNNNDKRNIYTGSTLSVLQELLSFYLFKLRLGENLRKVNLSIYRARSLKCPEGGN